MLSVEHHELEAPRARIVIVHGYAEHRGRYAALTRELEQHGFECHCFDLRGHGTSEGSRAHVPRFRDYIDDLERVSAGVPRDLPRFLLGHSLGGLIALSYARQHPATFDGLVASSPYLGPAFHVPKMQALGASVATLLLPAIQLRSPLDPGWVSRDPQVVDAYDDDPLVLSVTTPRWYTEVTAAQKTILESASEIRTPALILAGTDDRIADHRVTVQLFEHLGSDDKQLRLYEGLFHELFNELAEAREAVISDLLQWLEARIPPAC